MTRIFHWFFMWKIDPMSGCDIRLVFTLSPRDSTLQYKRCVQLWNNFPYITPLKHSGIKWKRCALCSWDFNINYRVSHETWQLRETIGCPTKHDNWEKLQGVPRNMTIETNYRVSHEIWKWRQTTGCPTKYDNWEKLQGVPRNMTIETTTGCPTKYDNWETTWKLSLLFNGCQRSRVNQNLKCFGRYMDAITK